MKAYTASYQLKTDAKETATLTVGAQSLAGAARKAEKEENTGARGELISVVRTDAVIL